MFCKISGSKNAFILIRRFFMVSINLNQEFIFSGKKTIIIVPETMSHEYERFLCEKYQNSICKDVEVLTFSRITRRIFEEIGGFSNEFLNDAGRILVVYKAISQNSNALKSFHAKKPDVAKHLLALIDEFKVQSISEEDIARIYEQSSGKIKDKLYDLYLIYTTYNQITSHEILDPRDEFQFLIDTFYKSTKFDDTIFYFDGFDIFTPKQYEFIEELIQKDIDISINFEFFDGYMQINDTLNQTVSKIENIGKKNKAFFEKKQKEANHYKFADISNNLYTLNDITIDCNDIFLHKSENIQNECLYTASKIIEILDYNKKNNIETSLDDFCVTSRNFDTYKTQLEIAFYELNIPIYISAKTNLSSTLPIKLIFSAFDAITSNFRSKEVIKYLKNPFIFGRKDINSLCEYITRWNIRYLGQNVRFTSNPKYKIEETNDDTLAELEVLNQYKNSVLSPIYSFSSSLKSSKVGYEYVMALFNFLEESELALKTLNLKTSDLKIKQEYDQIWDLIVDSLDQFNKIYGENELSSEEFFSLYKNTLLSYELSTIPSNADSIYASRFEESKKCKYLFILGANSEDLPKINSENGILTLKEKLYLKDNNLNLAEFGLGLIKYEKELIYKIFLKPCEKLFVSYSEISGSKRLPSEIFTRIKEISKKAEFSTDKSLNYNFLYKNKSTAMEHYAILNDLESISDIDNSKFSVLNGRLNDDIDISLARKIYKTELSPTQINQYNSCAFSYFLRFGLGLKSKENMEFSNLQNGNFIHYILEKCMQNIIKTEDFWIKNEHGDIIDIAHISKKLDELELDKKDILKKLNATKKKETMSLLNDNLLEIDNKNSWFIEQNKLFEVRLNQKLKDINPLINTYIDEYFSTFFNDNYSHDTLSKYDLNRIKSTSFILVENTLREIYCSSFKPKFCELSIGKKSDFIYKFNINDIFYSIIGKIDRVDFANFKDSDLSENLFKIVDYKSGKTEYDPTKILNGLDMQMFVYALALNKSMLAKTSSVVYSHAVVPTSDQKSDDILQVLNDKIKRSGVSCNNFGDEKIENTNFKYAVSSNKNFRKIDFITNEGFQNLVNAVSKNLELTAQNISSGNCNPNPYKYKEKTPCSYCTFNNICGFCDEYDDFRTFDTVKSDYFEPKEDSEND